MNISVIVVTYNEEDNIQDCLDSLIAQQYTLGKFEIIVVDGESQDQTVAIVQKYAEIQDQIKLVSNPKQTISSNRNVGVCEAAYDFIAFTDADCICPVDWLEILAGSFNNLEGNIKNLAAVGGGNTAGADQGPAAETIAIAFEFPLASLGSAQTCRWTTNKRVESLACLNVLYRKLVIEQIGGFDESLGNMGEDWDLNYRLRKNGYELYYVPGATVIHKMRPTLRSFAKQMYNYGQGRAKLMKKHKENVQWKYLLPIVFLSGLFLSILLTTVYPFFLLIPLLYLFIIFIMSLSKINKMFLLSRILISIHFCYSTGLLKGLLKK